VCGKNADMSLCGKMLGLPHKEDLQKRLSGKSRKEGSAVRRAGECLSPGVWAVCGVCVHGGWIFTVESRGEEG